MNCHHHFACMLIAFMLVVFALLPSTLVLSFFLSEWRWPANLFQQMCKQMTTQMGHFHLQTPGVLVTGGSLPFAFASYK